MTRRPLATPTPQHPDWTALVAARDAGVDRDETAWRQALAHLDACGGCRRPALAADPTLLFRALPRVPVAGSEAAAMRDAVASMRRARRVAPEPPAGLVARAAARLAANRPVAAVLGRRARGLAAAALLAAASAGLWAALPAADRAPAAQVTGAPGAAAPQAARAASAPAASGPALSAASGTALSAASGTTLSAASGTTLSAASGTTRPAGAAPSPAEPVFMDLSLPASADVYRVGSGGMQVVMVVDERLDV